MARQLRIHLFIDYQNVHLVGHGLFAPTGTPPHQTLVDPRKLADVIDQKRLAAGKPGMINAVYVFRGLPSNKHEPAANRRNKMQASEWTRDRRVAVTHRSLRYLDSWPTTPVREKGVDVLLAVRFVEEALKSQADVLILASRDSDLAPAIEMALGVANPPIVEVCNWDGGGRLRPSAKSGTQDSVWCTWLNGDSFAAVRDQREYP